MHSYYLKISIRIEFQFVHLLSNTMSTSINITPHYFDHTGRGGVSNFKLLVQFPQLLLISLPLRNKIVTKKHSAGVYNLSLILVQNYAMIEVFPNLLKETHDNRERSDTRSLKSKHEEGLDSELVYNQVYIKVISKSQPENFNQSWIILYSFMIWLYNVINYS